MAWTLSGITIHPESEEDIESIESHYAIQDVVDATVSTISFYGAGSNRRSIKFTLFENENSNIGRTSLKNALRADSNVALVSDQGSQGNFRILSLEFSRLQALNYTQPVYHCAAELIEV